MLGRESTKGYTDFLRIVSLFQKPICFFTGLIWALPEQLLGVEDGGC